MKTPRIRSFSKVEGLGNDFILVDLREMAAASLSGALEQLEAVATAWCDRRTGVGADGILAITPAPDAHARMIVFNADGSRPEMCGNGLRCAAAHVAGAWSSTPTAAHASVVVIATDAGPRTCLLTEPNDQSRTILVDVDMAPATLLDLIEVASAPSHPLQVVSMGNPHAVHFTSDAEDPEVLARSLGPTIERDPAFPAGTNVEFVRRERDDVFRVWVWERGCGITHACGTGACAVAAAAVAGGLASFDRPLTMRLPGGDLRVTIPSDPSAGVRMCGPARLVFQGNAPPLPDT